MAARTSLTDPGNAQRALHQDENRAQLPLRFEMGQHVQASLVIARFEAGHEGLPGWTRAVDPQVGRHAICTLADHFDLTFRSLLAGPPRTQMRGLIQHLQIPAA